MTSPVVIDWQPIQTLPKVGRFLLAKYAPTNWAFHVSECRFYDHTEGHKPGSKGYTDGERIMETSRRMAMQWARAWAPYPNEPSLDVQKESAGVE